jgi:hypothetical protein
MPPIILYVCTKLFTALLATAASSIQQVVRLHQLLYEVRFRGRNSGLQLPCCAWFVLQGMPPIICLFAPAHAASAQGEYDVGIYPWWRLVF